MTREETLKNFKNWCQRYIGNDGSEIDIHMANNIIAMLEAEPCEDAVIRADTLQSFVSYCEKNCQYSKKQRYVMCGACMMGDAIEIVEDLPPVTPKQKMGKWIGIDEEPHEDYECSCCGYVVSTFTANIEPHTEYKYCPNCGAKMEGESECRTV